MGLINKQIERSNGNLLLYMITAARLSYTQRWKDLPILTMAGEADRIGGHDKIDSFD